MSNLSSKLSTNLTQLIKQDIPINLTKSHHFNHSFKNYLHELDQIAKSQKLKSNTWMIFTSAALVSLNCPVAFNPFWQTLRAQIKSTHPSPSVPQALQETALLIRETNLKTISFIGIAKAINALGSFYETLKDQDPETLAGLSGTKARRVPRTIEGNLNQALKLWTSIYRPLDEKLIHKLTQFHPDLPVHILHSHYGALLSDPPNSLGPVGRIGTSLIAVSSLRATGNLGPQLTSHVFGLKKAGDEVRNGEVDGNGEVGEGHAWMTSDEGAEWVVRSVDRLAKIVEESMVELGQVENLPKSKL